jgi:hypothetical protein
VVKVKDQNDWYKGIAKKIDRYKDSFSPREYKTYKLDLLVRISKRISSFSSDCRGCQNFKTEINELVEILENILQSSREERRGYFNSINYIVKHLKEKHKLISDGQNIALWLPLGICFGAPFGILFDNIAIGIPIGMAIGVAIGASLDAKAKKEGRVI